MDDKHIRRGADVLEDGAMPVPREEHVLAGHGTQPGHRKVISDVAYSDAAFLRKRRAAVAE
eukprot:4398773-Prorocentrum_lima.AAC.1